MFIPGSSLRRNSTISQTSDSGSEDISRRVLNNCTDAGRQIPRCTSDNHRMTRLHCCCALGKQKELMSSPIMSTRIRTCLGSRSAHASHRVTRLRCCFAPGKRACRSQLQGVESYPDKPKILSCYDCKRIICLASCLALEPVNISKPVSVRRVQTE
jgi:hypothetical protein